MSSAIKIKIYPWSNEVFIRTGGLDFEKGEIVIIKTEQGVEAVPVAEVVEGENIELDNSIYLLRKANSEDLRKIEELRKKIPESERYCKKMIEKHKLPMKLVETFFSFDGGRITFSFVADGRVNFRELVKDLTRHFQKSIRLQQVGMRDEARREGGFGPCGRPLCCITHLKKLGNISTDFARDQQIAHRGSERLSGVCGKLLCCLAFEEDFYKEMGKKFPPLESEVRTKKGKGKVVSWNILKNSYKVELADGSVIEVSLNK